MAYSKIGAYKHLKEVEMLFDDLKNFVEDVI